MSRKFLFVIFWNIIMTVAAFLQIYSFKIGATLVLPLTEITIISGIITGVYFGVNVLSKTLTQGTSIIPEEEIEKMVADVQKTEDVTTPRYASKKFFLTAYWCIYVLFLMIAQLILTTLKLPLMESIAITAILTGAYFGTNMLDKVVTPKTPTVPPSTTPTQIPVAPVS
jgi:hypothetical protein